MSSYKRLKTIVIILCFALSIDHAFAHDNEDQRIAAKKFVAGMTAARAGQFSQGKKLLLEAVAYDPSDVYSGHLAFVSFKDNDFENASKYSALTIKQSNEMYFGHWVLGLVLEHRKDFAAAFKELRQGSRLASKDVAGPRQDLLKFVRLHKEFAPGFDIAYEDRIGELRNLVRSNNWSKAYALSASQMRADPNDADLRCLRGRVLEGTDRMSDARSEFEASMQLGSDQAFLCMAQLDLAENKKAQAIPYLKECLRRNTNVIDALRLLAGCYLSQSAFIEAIDACDKLVVMEPNKPGSYLARANVYLKAKRYKEAIADCTTGIKFIQDRSVLSGVYRDRARAYELSGQPELAKKDLAQASKLSDQVNSDLFPSHKNGY